MTDQLTPGGGAVFAGNIFGYRLNSNKHLDAEESAYVKVSLNGGNVSIGYKRWSKMKSDHANKVAVASADH
ncbi:MAG: hypothetical protein AAGD13_09270 [Pseudomonadota bacterium]